MAKPDTDLLVKWLDSIRLHGVNLTTWEEEFIESMCDKVDSYGDRAIFSDKMAEQIERIYTERVP